MKIILKKSIISFTPVPSPGQLVTIDLEWDANYTPGYAIKSTNKIETTSLSNAGVSIAYPCEGFDKIIVTNAAKQSAFCQLSFFDDTSSINGHDGVTVAGNTGVEDIEVDIPDGARYVRFTANINTAGILQEGRIVQMRGTVVS